MSLPAQRRTRLLLTLVLCLGARAANPERPSVPASVQVTGIRHWSTPTYTRVAIDLAGEVTFQAARVPAPDRIFFDLHNTRLTPALDGHSFAVTDDGFLKHIRAAQTAPGITRIVLDVNQVTEYSAFLLPNPYRLIIDIHGAKTSAPQPELPQPAPAPPDPNPDPLDRPVTLASTRRATVAANTSGLPPMPITDGGPLVHSGESQPQPAPNLTPTRSPRVVASTRPTPTHPVPNATPEQATPDQASTEVASLDRSPGRVDATPAPTTRPIAARTLVAGPATPTRPAQHTATGETSLIRALGLHINRIVIDPGHGGHDSGTLGVDGIEEKDIVLDVALRLGKALHDRLGAEIIYTRPDDTFIPLETRTAIANKAEADLFLSIHANSSDDPSARGVETYFLNFTSDPTALDVAARENAVSGQSVHQLSDLVKKITLKDKIAESREFASDVESSLYTGLERGNAGLKNRGIKKAPFVVLIGANMPSVLAEISFVTNPRDAAQLRTPDYRQRVAESLFAGIAHYEASLGGPKPSAKFTSRASLR